ncbi:hypothetical protein [Ruegeria denitrificans]|uniref:hypothetical protein n=1 Tax=Ruegeria denitrificans TaxID=1715692 RepID=UPI003C7A6F46
MTDIQLIFSVDDFEEANTLQKALEDEGLTVSTQIRDAFQGRGGARETVTSASVVVSLLSKHSIKLDWFLEETQNAARFNKLVAVGATGLHHKAIPNELSVGTVFDLYEFEKISSACRRIEKIRGSRNPILLSWALSADQDSLQSVATKYISLFLAILGLSGLADGLVEWREFFSYGLLRHYLELRNFCLSLVPFHLPTWVGDYVTLGLAFTFPVKGMHNDVSSKIRRIKNRISFLNRWLGENRNSFEKLKKTFVRKSEDWELVNRSYEAPTASSIRDASDKTAAKILKEQASRRRYIAQNSSTIEKFEEREAESRKQANDLRQAKRFSALLGRSRLFIFSIWPVVLIAASLFVFGIIGGFDRIIFKAYLRELSKLVVGFVVALFLVVDIRRTL